MCALTEARCRRLIAISAIKNFRPPYDPDYLPRLSTFAGEPRRICLKPLRELANMVGTLSSHPPLEVSGSCLTIVNKSTPGSSVHVPNSREVSTNPCFP